MSGDHNQYQKDKSYLDFECPRCGHCCQQEHMTIIDKGCYERGCACYDDRVDKDGVAVVARQWQGLTDEEMSEIIDREIGFNSCWGPEEKFARAIEQALREKNT